MTLLEESGLVFRDQDSLGVRSTITPVTKVAVVPKALRHSP